MEKIESQYNHRDTYKVRLIVGAAALCVFLLMHYLYTSRIGIQFDLAAGEAVRSLRMPFLNEIMIAITHSANWKTLVGLGVIIIIIDIVKWKKPIYPMAFAAALVTLGVYKLLKVIVQRPRPSQIFWLVVEEGYSFPSGHSMNGMFCYGIMIYLLWRECSDDRIKKAVTAALCVLIPLIGFSRIYCGVHHPTDVIAGLAMGLALLMASTMILDEILLRMDTRPKKEK